MLNCKYCGELTRYNIDICDECKEKRSKKQYQIIHYNKINHFITKIEVYGEYTIDEVGEEAKKIHQETGGKVEIVRLMKVLEEVEDD